MIPQQLEMADVERYENNFLTVHECDHPELGGDWAYYLGGLYEFQKVVAAQIVGDLVFRPLGRFLEGGKGWLFAVGVLGPTGPALRSHLWENGFRPLEGSGGDAQPSEVKGDR